MTDKVVTLNDYRPYTKLCDGEKIISCGDCKCQELYVSTATMDIYCASCLDLLMPPEIDEDIEVTFTPDFDLEDTEE